MDSTLADFLARIDAVQDPADRHRLRKLMGEALVAAPSEHELNLTPQPEPKLPGGRDLPSADLATVQEQYVNVVIELDQISQLLSQYVMIFPNAAPGTLDRVAMVLVPLVDQIVQTMKINPSGEVTIPKTLADALHWWTMVGSAQTVALSEFAEWAREQLVYAADDDHVRDGEDPNVDAARRVRANLQATGIIE